MTENRVPLALAQRVEDDWWAMSEPAAPEVLQGAIEAHLDELAALVAPPQPEPVARETLRVGDRVRIVSEAVLTTIDECGESWDGNSPDSSTTYYLLDRPDPLAKYLRNVVECYLDDEDQDNLVADLVAKLRAPGAPPVEPEPVGDEALVKVVVDWVRNPRYISSSDEDYARELVQRLYAKAVQL